MKRIVRRAKASSVPSADYFVPRPGAARTTAEINESFRGAFNCYFDAGDKLVMSDGQPYVYDELTYEPLAGLVAAYVQACIKERYSLSEVFEPADSALQTNILMSEDLASNQDTCLVVIQGAGKVRAGQWSRKLCINNDLSVGSCMPYIAQARLLGFSVIVLNPNFNSIEGRPIPGHATPLDHCDSIWRRYISQSPARKLFILAHSCGGICTVHLLSTFSRDFMRRVKAIGFTDSVHKDLTRLTPENKKFLATTAVNWKLSSKRLNTLLSKAAASRNGCENRSAGHLDHEWSSASAYEAVWGYFSQK